MKLLIFLVAGLIIFGFFRLLGKVATVLIRRKTFRSGILAVLPFVELLTWTGYAFWGISVLFGSFVYYDLILGVAAVLLLLAFAWFVFRDFLAGVLLKAEQSLEPGRFIRAPFAEGYIQSLGARSLVLVNARGEVVRIPYSRINKEMFVFPPEDDESLPHHLKLPIPATRDPEAHKRLAEKELMAMPWITGSSPFVDIVEEEDGSYRLHLTFYTHIRSQGALVGERIRKSLSVAADSEFNQFGQ